MASPWMVTSRRKVHVRTCPVARRVAFPYSWIPDVQKPKGRACMTCLGGVLPTQADLTTTHPTASAGLAGTEGERDE